MNFINSLHPRKLHFTIGVSFLFTIFLVLSLQTTYAVELTYDEKLEFVNKMEQIEGHIFAAMENVAAGNTTVTKMHLSHPIEVMYELIDADLADYEQYNKKLELLLFILKNSNLNIDEEEFDESMNQISKTIEDGKKLVAGKTLENPVFKIQLIGKLLDAAKISYEQGMSLNDNPKLMKLQDSYGFVVQANMILTGIDDFTQDQKQKINIKFIELYSAFGNQASSEKIISMMDDISNILDEFNIEK